jgi:hypothetical protein
MTMQQPSLYPRRTRPLQSSEKRRLPLLYWPHRKGEKKKGRTFKIFLASQKTKTSIQRKVIDDTSSVYYVSRHESNTPQNTPKTKTKKKGSEISQGSPTTSFASETRQYTRHVPRKTQSDF